jgi:NADP-dependent 3-hydroxy acid dehydrogenase YdfG
MIHFLFFLFFATLNYVFSDPAPIAHHHHKRDIVIVITGCSSGIGFTTALTLSENPQFKVWATMRDISKSTLPTDRINLKIATMDVTDEESIQIAIQQILVEDGGIDVLINNAGYGLAGALETAYIAEAQALFDVNFWGVVRVTQAVLPIMRTRRWGYIINISSTSGIRGIPCMEYYTASKFALEGLMDSMRYSLSVFNISITNLNAGPVKTSFTERFGISSVGGRGTRSVELDEYHYLQQLTDRMVAGLSYRIHQSQEGQKTEEISRLLNNLIILKTHAKHLVDIPFNIGSSVDSQKLIEEIRKQPTAWGGIYNEILKSVPPLPKPSEVEDEDEDEEEEDSVHEEL